MNRVHIDKLKILLASVFVIFVMTSCWNSDKDISPRLAQVNEDVLTEAGLKSQFSDSEWKALSQQDKKKYIEQWVQLTILAQEASEKELDKDIKIKQRIEFSVKKVKANALIAERMSRLYIGETELFNYFRVHQAEFLKPVLEYKVQRIFVSDKSALENVQNALKQGMAFDLAVRNNSREQLRNEGGFMGFVTYNGVDSLFWKAASQLKAGEVGELKTDDGYFLMRYTEERKSSQEADFELYKDVIRRRIQTEKRDEVYNALLQEARKKNYEIYYY